MDEKVAKETFVRLIYIKLKILVFLEEGKKVMCLCMGTQGI